MTLVELWKMSLHFIARLIAWREGFADWVPLKSLYSPSTPVIPPPIPLIKKVEKPQKSGCTKIIVYLALGLIGLGILNGIISSGSKSSSSPSSQNNSQPDSTPSIPAAESPKLFSVGETCKIENFDFTVESVKVFRSLGDTSASEGGVYVCVKFKYKNTSDKPIGAWSLPSITKLISPKGVQYTSDLGATVGSTGASVGNSDRGNQSAIPSRQ